MSIFSWHVSHRIHRRAVSQWPTCLPALVGPTPTSGGKVQHKDCPQRLVAALAKSTKELAETKRVQLKRPWSKHGPCFRRSWSFFEPLQNDGLQGDLEGVCVFWTLFNDPFLDYPLQYYGRNYGCGSAWHATRPPWAGFWARP